LPILGGKMKSEETFISKIRKQLFPYRPEKDIEVQADKWDISEGEYITSWLRMNLINCRRANGCEKEERCRFFGYTDLAKQNYSICREMILRIENGEINCELEGKKLKD
jgi:hypothetical protein